MFHRDTWFHNILQVPYSGILTYSKNKSRPNLPNMNINQSNDAIWWISGMNIDGDGAPNCYSPDNKGLDYLANAGKPGNWYGIVTDSNGNPIIQGPNDPYPGFYVSPTALQDKSKNRTDPNRYVDSTKIRYIS